MSEPLDEISKALAALIQDQEARIYTFVETGYDETGTVATSDGYLRFAKLLVDFVAAAQQGERETLSYGGVEGSCDGGFMGAVFSSISEVQLDSALLVATEEEAEQVTRYFQREFPPE